MTGREAAVTWARVRLKLGRSGWRILALRPVRGLLRTVGRVLCGQPAVSVGDQNHGFFKLGWETLSVEPPADHVVDIRCHRLPFADDSVACVNASHVAEHLRDDEVRFFAGEVLRVLRPRGVFRVVVPDLQRFIDSYWNDGLALHFDRPVAPGLTMRSWLAGEVRAGRQDPGVLAPHNGLISVVASYTNGHPLPVARREDVESRLRGGSVEGFVRWCVSLKDSSRDDHGHFNGFTFDRLRAVLLQAGFARVDRSEYAAPCGHRLLRGIDRADKNGISLYVNAHKGEPPVTLP